MRQAWTVARNEFRSYFDHAAAYILVVAFLVLALFLTFRGLYAMGVATLRGFFGLLPWLFTVFVPAITMRAFAEERRSGTLEWLVAQPLRETDLLAGKFLGDWLFALVALAGTLPTAIGVLALSKADPGIMVAQYVGAALLAAAMVGIGLFASSVTTNQITAFILGAAITFVLVLIGLPVVTVGLPPALGNAAARLSLMSHFDSIVRGVLDLRDVIYFLTTAAFFLAFAYFALMRQRLSAGRGAYRRLRLGTVVLAVGIVVVDLLGAHIHGRLDLTRNHLFTLSRGTDQVLGNLNDVVTIKLFRSAELPPEVQLTLRDVRDLLSDFKRASDGKVHVQVLDPDKSEGVAAQARSAGVTQIQFNVMRNNEFQVKRGWLGLAIYYADQHKAIPVIDQANDMEYRLTSLISSMVNPRKPRLAVLTGFGARSAFGFPALQKALNNRYDIRSVNLQTDSTPPVISRDSTDVIVLAGPTQPLSPGAIHAINSFLDAGGAGLFLVGGIQVDQRQGVARPLYTGIDSLLTPRGVRVRHDLVADYRSNEQVSLGRQGVFSVVTPYPLWPGVTPAGSAVLTQGLSSMVLPWASPLEITDSARAKPLWVTSKFGGIYAAGMPISPQTMPDPKPGSLGVQVVAVEVMPEGSAGKPASQAKTPAKGTASATVKDPPPAVKKAGIGLGGARTGTATKATPTTKTPDRGRLVVVGDADFLSQNFVQANPQNLAFAANAVDWLAQSDALISIRSKDRTPPPLVFQSNAARNQLKWGNLVGVPLLFVLLGLFRVGTRVSRSRRAWEEV
ncbi:MAG: Gldg family protein [Gemmatimonadota bacterium]